MGNLRPVISFYDLIYIDIQFICLALIFFHLLAPKPNLEIFLFIQTRGQFTMGFKIPYDTGLRASAKTV
jgi:hypothetical protein